MDMMFGELLPSAVDSAKAMDSAHQKRARSGPLRIAAHAMALALNCFAAI